jgi:predicted CXXCH cytochrome family protein
MNVISRYITIFFITGGIFICSVLAPSVQAQNLSGTIVDTKHNLSISGPGAVKSTTEDRICIFCHAPHNSSPIGFLWNRFDPPDNYTPYQSTTIYATVGQPTGSSKMCLSCHDGTIALGALVSEKVEIPFAGGLRFIPAGPEKLGTDLSDDHPVSFVYDASLTASNTELAPPTTLPSEIRLDSNNLMQCTSCHDPHNNTNGKFLVMPNDNSNLCIACHVKNGWSLSSHSLSGATWNNSGPDPWPENCHKPHTAARHERLLNNFFEEDNCLSCHNGNVSGTDIESELLKSKKHAVQSYTGIHDASEDFSGTVVKHVECSDCHNAHQSNSNPSTGAPVISGMNEGVAGIDSIGQPVVPAANLFEICYKCHADNNVISTLSIDRDIQQLNTRLEFDRNNPSYHPVEGTGVNPNVPSLRVPYTTSSVIYCTDCHNNDNPSGPGGPHGSSYNYLLELNYVTEDNTIENSFNYALCYKCHDSTSILGNESFLNHQTHIQVYNAPCSACHDAHGISSTQGNAVNNSNLINWSVYGNLYASMPRIRP